MASKPVFMFTLTSTSRFEQEIKKSRFLAIAAPVADEAEAKAFIARNSDRSANHNCWAWRIGQSYRFNDDGEPGGTAGKPILQAIDGQSLTNVIILVTRWFGGILLGSGGLVRAYGGTAALCLKEAPREEIIPYTVFILNIGFSDHALIKARVLNKPYINILQEDFTQTGASLLLRIPDNEAQAVITFVKDLTSGRAFIQEERDSAK